MPRPPFAPLLHCARFVLPILGCASLIVAGPVMAGGVAAAGPCAEPREAISGVAPSQSSSVGALQSFFAPADVAAPAAQPNRGAPVAAAAIRPGVCDQPGARCARLAEPVSQSITPGTKPPSRPPVQKPPPIKKPVRPPAKKPHEHPHKSSGKHHGKQHAGQHHGGHHGEHHAKPSISAGIKK